MFVHRWGQPGDNGAGRHTSGGDLSAGRTRWPASTRRCGPRSFVARVLAPLSAGRGALDVVGVRLLDPAHQLAELLAGALDRVLGTLLAQRLELRAARVLVVDEPLGERAVLDVGEDGL